MPRLTQALFVGAQNYHHADRIRRLHCPWRDVRALKQRFVSHLGWRPDDIVVLGGGEGAQASSTRDAIIRELERLAALDWSAEDVLVLFFSGHGAEIGGQMYLFPEDATPPPWGDDKGRCIGFDEIGHYLAGEKASRAQRVFWLDCCRRWLAVSETENDKGPAVSRWSENAVRHVQERLIRPNANPTAVFYACSPGTHGVAYEYPDENRGHGLFCQAMLDALDRWDGPVLLDFVNHDDLRSKVIEEAKAIRSKDVAWAPAQYQTPWCDAPHHPPRIPILGGAALRTRPPRGDRPVKLRRSSVPALYLTKGDWAPSPMVLVPGGWYVFGRGPAEISMYVESFYIEAFPMVGRGVLAVAEGGEAVQAWIQRWPALADSYAKTPFLVRARECAHYGIAAKVDYFDARLCAELSQMRLPSEFELEAALAPDCPARALSETRLAPWSQVCQDPRAVQILRDVTCGAWGSEECPALGTSWCGCAHFMADGIYEWSGSPYIPYFGLFGSEHLGVDTPRPDEVGDPGRFLLAVRGAGGTVVGRASRPALRRVPAVTFRRAISANLVEVDD